jgi:sigma-E factor negative regulatory protein RseA
MVSDNFQQTFPQQLPPGPGRHDTGPWSQTNIMQRSPDSSPDAQRQALSALMDGDLPAGELTAAIASWSNDVDARAGWHAYHLIGDVLRSDDLAARPTHDEAFLHALRGRLAQEPAPSALTPLLAAAPHRAADPGLAEQPAARRRAAGWLIAPAAVAAGFVVVAGIMVVTKVMAPDPTAAPQLASAQPATPATTSTLLVRDARLDRYLAAHRSLGNGLAGAGVAERTVQIVYEPK